MINPTTDQDLLSQIEIILQNKSTVSEEDYKEALQIKKDILDDIQKELIKSRRKKINKLMNIPEPPMSKEKKEKLENIKHRLKKFGWKLD